MQHLNLDEVRRRPLRYVRLGGRSKDGRCRLRAQPHGDDEDRGHGADRDP